MIICMCSINVSSTQICLYYFLIYLITILSFWSLVLIIETKYGQSFNSWLQWGGLFNNSILLRLYLIIILLSLGGLPPLVAFYAKILLFKGLLSSSMYTVTFILVIFSLLSVFYYIRII